MVLGFVLPVFYLDHADKVPGSIADMEFPGRIGRTVVLVGSQSGETFPTRVTRHIADIASSGEDVVVGLDFILVKGVGGEASTNKKLTDSVVVGPNGEVFGIGEGV